MNEIRIERLKTLVRKYGSQAKLIESGEDINKAYISQLINGTRSMGEKAARNLEKKLGLPTYFFDETSSEQREIGKPEGSIDFMLRPKVKVDGVQESVAHYELPHNKEVPLISRVQAGAWQEASDPFEPGDADEWYICPTRHSDSTYALEVEGDSMTSPVGRSYPAGMIIFVDPEREAASGDRVVAKVNGDNEATFKQLVIDGERKYLKPLNPAYPVITDPFRVLGKVIGAYMKE